MKQFRIFFILVFFILPLSSASAQNLSAQDLFLKMRGKLLAVQDYTADIKMKVDISFLRMPAIRGILYFKAPDKLRLERNGGISILPKKNISLTLNNLVPSGNVTVIDAGADMVNTNPVRVIKVIPDNDASGIVLTKIWVDENRLLALRTETTTRDNGTVKMDLKYGKYVAWSLPDEVTFVVDVKEFKLPKGMTMDYEGGDNHTQTQATSHKQKKGTIQIKYLSYKINTGLSDEVFHDKKK